MTDITELAQRLKLEVHRAVSNFNPQMNIKTRDLNELVEALEKAQLSIAELESRTVKLPPTFRYEHDDLSRDVPVLDKRLVKKMLREAGIKVEAE